MQVYDHKIGAGHQDLGLTRVGRLGIASGVTVLHEGRSAPDTAVGQSPRDHR